MDNYIGKKIYDLRKMRGMTQEEVGAIVGVTKATIQKYEAGVVKNLRRPTIEKLAVALNTSPGYLMGWTENTTVSSVAAIHTASKEEVELLRIFNGLNVRDRMSLLNTAIQLEEKENHNEG
ncbi:MAG: helix-turn-helix transcriptional regulator [Clostridia bacterium]|nr:helix-turn-helix transcriptional regulator [Clostridia bacterium]